MSLSEKRHHRARLKKKRRYHWGRDLLTDEKELAKAIDTPTPCSCAGCGSSRKFRGNTMQERKMNEVQQDEI